MGWGGGGGGVRKTINVDLTSERWPWWVARYDIRKVGAVCFWQFNQWGCCPLSADHAIDDFQFNTTATTDSTSTEPVPDGVREQGPYSHKQTLTLCVWGGRGGEEVVPTP